MVTAKVLLILTALFSGEAEPRVHAAPMPSVEACVAKGKDAVEYQKKYVPEVTGLKVECVELDK